MKEKIRLRNTANIVYEESRHTHQVAKDNQTVRHGVLEALKLTSILGLESPTEIRRTVRRYLRAMSIRK